MSRHAVLQGGQRVAGAGLTAAGSGGDVHGLLDQDPRVVLGFELGGTVRERLVDASAGGAHELSGGGLLVLGQPADLTVGKAQRGLFAGVRQAHGLEFIERGGGGYGGNGLVYGGGNGGFIQRVRDGGARQSFSHLLFLATSRVMPTAEAPASVPSAALPSSTYGRVTAMVTGQSPRPSNAGIPPAGTLPQSS